MTRLLITRFIICIGLGSLFHKCQLENCTKSSDMVLSPVLYKELKKQRFWLVINAPLFIQITQKTCKNSQEIHLHPTHKHLAKLAVVHISLTSILDTLFSINSPPSSHPLFFQSPYCGNRDPSPALSLTPFVPSTPAHPPSCQGPASHVHHWVMDGVEGRHPTLQSSLIPSAMQTPPNHSGEHY